MAETLTVALRVAEEAIEEAIAKAEEFSDSLVRYPTVSLSLTPSVSRCLSSLFWSQYQQDAVIVLTTTSLLLDNSQLF